MEPLLTSINDLKKGLGLSRTTIYALIGKDQLGTLKIGNRTLDNGHFDP